MEQSEQTKARAGSASSGVPFAGSPPGPVGEVGTLGKYPGQVSDFVRASRPKLQARFADRNASKSLHSIRDQASRKTVL